jgi:riboflavin synthase
MFTGIIEQTGVILDVFDTGTNRSFLVGSGLSGQLKVDQSVSHSGVCLTVEKLEENSHQVTAIAETLSKTNLGHWQKGTIINIERCVPMNGRLDGHLVQGHVDATAICAAVEDQNGSWLYTFQYPSEFAHLLIEKGSICVNGISLTAFGLVDNRFSVAIIPYTYEQTNLKQVKAGDSINLEFDMVGKYLARWKQLGL